jgi:hypothetical protein
LGIFAFFSPIGAQEEWNHPRALELISQARDVRQGLVQDSSLQSYSSNARGYVYFYLDREDTGERILVKTDQIALEVYWRAPGETKQRIVGMRDEEQLPTNIRYHLDHLVVVQDEFGDRIRIGDGDEVEAVIHPAAPGSESTYDFLLADSITLSVTATADTVRVYEIQVRPKDFGAPGFVGSVFLDRDSKSIVRMDFTFTPASYVDNYLDHISISLENSLWEGEYWLPYRQQLEIRREVPYLDIPAGSVIRGAFEVRDYQINPSLPPSLFLGRPVSALPEEARKAFPFEEELHARLDEEGLQGYRPPPEMDEIRSLALSIAKDRYLSGLGRTRLFLPSPTASSALRYNRAEGLFLGGGVSHTPVTNLGLSLYGGFSIGREKPTLEAGINGGQARPESGLRIFLNRPRDLGPIRAISGVVNTFSSAILNDDYTDLFFSTGGSTSHSFSPWTDGELTLEARWERHRSGQDVVSADLDDTDFRPVLPVDEGIWTSLRASGSFPTPWPHVRLSADAEVGRFKDRGMGALSAALTYQRRWLTLGTDLQLDLRGGSLLGEAPIQAHYFLGGRQTVPGYSFRSRVGDRFWLFRAEGSIDLLRPFLRLRAFTAAGDTRSPAFDDPTLAELAAQSDYLLAAGLGFGVGWDVLRFDLARGLRGGGEWEFLFWVKKDFWPWL